MRVLELALMSIVNVAIGSLVLATQESTYDVIEGQAVSEEFLALSDDVSPKSLVNFSFRRAFNGLQILGDRMRFEVTFEPHDRKTVSSVIVYFGESTRMELSRLVIGDSGVDITLKDAGNIILARGSGMPFTLIPKLRGPAKAEQRIVVMGPVKPHDGQLAIIVSGEETNPDYYDFVQTDSAIPELVNRVSEIWARTGVDSIHSWAKVEGRVSAGKDAELELIASEIVEYQLSATLKGKGETKSLIIRPQINKGKSQ